MSRRLSIKANLESCEAGHMFEEFMSLGANCLSFQELMQDRVSSIVLPQSHLRLQKTQRCAAWLKCQYLKRHPLGCIPELLLFKSILEH